MSKFDYFSNRRSKHQNNVDTNKHDEGVNKNGAKEGERNKNGGNIKEGNPKQQKQQQQQQQRQQQQQQGDGNTSKS